MRFWQKIFLSTIIIFFILFDIAAYILISYSYNFSLQRETDNAVREQSVILSSIQSSISNASALFTNVAHDKTRLTAIILPLSDYYKNQGVQLALYDRNTKIFGSFDVNQQLVNVQGNNNKNINEQITGTKRYLFVASKIPFYSNLTFVYSRDISQLDIFRTNIIRVFAIVSSILCFVLGASTYILLKNLTRPLNELNLITREIANGAYGKRVNIKRKDELGDLGSSFNSMADSVENNMAELEKNFNDKQQFIDNLSHEMKTPLTSILGYSEYLQKAVSNDELRTIAAGHLHEATERLQNLSTKLLELTYIRSGEIKLLEVNVKSLFIDLKNLMSLSLTEKKLQLETIVKLDFIKGDYILLLSMLTNLVENAARASSENMKITVKAFYDENPIIEVVDYGCGIDESQIQKITEPFYRVDKSRSREFGGVGLGLSIVKQIIELHGAKLEIQSQMNKGTIIRISFTSQ